MKKKTKRIVLLSAIAAFLIAAVVTTVIIVVSVSKNKFEGIWHSDNNTISYQFYEDATVKAIFNNTELPVINTKYTGSFEGVYAYDKSDKELSVTLDIYSKKITVHYTYEFDGDILILTDSSTKNQQKYIPEETD